MVIRLVCGGVIALPLGCGGESTASQHVPAAPTQVVASPFSKRVSIAWQSVNDAESYTVYWATSAGVTKATGTAIIGASSPYAHTGLTNGTTYYYIVTATNGAGESAASPEVSAAPFNTAPIALAGVDQTASTAALVVLNGVASNDADGEALTYSWTEIAGPPITLNDPTVPNPSFRTPRFLWVFKFALTVSDGEATSLPDTVTVTVDRFTQLPIAYDVTTANSDTETPGKLAVGALDSARFLVVSCRTGAGVTNPGLFGTTLDTVMAYVQVFPIADHNCESPRPSMATDGTGWLLAFARNGGIVAIKLTPSLIGFSVASESVISTGTSNSAPSVAFDGTGYLVTWNKFIDYPNGHDIYGARVTSSGQSLGELPIFVHTGEQVFSAVAFDGVNYLVVWRDTRSGSGPADDTDIYGTRVTPDGTVLDTASIAISTAAHFQGEPQLAFDGTNYLVVWEDARRYPAATQPPLDIFGTRVSPAGALLDGPATTGGIPIVTANPSPGVISYASAMFDGTNYFVTFSVAGFFEPAGVYFARVSPGGQLLDGPADQLVRRASGPTPTFARLVHPTMASRDGISLLAWVNCIELAGAAKDVIGVVVEP